MGWPESDDERFVWRMGLVDFGDLCETTEGNGRGRSKSVCSNRHPLGNVKYGCFCSSAADGRSCGSLDNNFRAILNMKREAHTFGNTGTENRVQTLTVLYRVGQVEAICVQKANGVELHT
jgi:hypothetical protein